MDYIKVVKDSIQTSLELKIFKTYDDSSFAHVFFSKITRLDKTKWKKLTNFDSKRLQLTAEEAYTKETSPRGIRDVKSVKYHQKVLKYGYDVQPIWIFKYKNELILLDGAHRLVASFIENRKYIYAYIIDLNKKKI